MTESPEAEGTAVLSHRQTVTVIAALMAGLFLAAIDTTIVATALPAIVGDLGGVDQLAWVVVAYLLTTTASTPLWGKLSDLYGRRICFQATIVAFIVGSVLAGAAQTMTQLVAYRAIQGIGGGGLFAVSFAIVGDIVTPRQRGRYMGYFTAVFAGAGIIGPLVGGFFVDQLTWRWIFFINLPIGAVALFIASVALRIPQNRRDAKVDGFGAVLLVGSIVSIVLVTFWGGSEYPWISPPVLGLLAASVVLGGVFIWWEHKASEPVLPMRLFHNPVVAVTLSLSFLAGTALYAATVFLPVFLQGVTGTSATNSGLLLSPMMLGVSASAVVTGRITTKTGRYKIFVIVGLALLVANMAFLSTIAADTSQLVIGSAMVVQGLAIGAMMPVLTTATQNAVEMRDLGAGTSAVQFTRSLGGSLGVAVFGALFASRLSSSLADIGSQIPIPAGLDADQLANSPSIIAGLPSELRAEVMDAVASAVGFVFLAAVPIAALALFIGFLLKELPLRDFAAGPAPSPPQAEITPLPDERLIRVRAPYLELVRRAATLDLGLATHLGRAGPVDEGLASSVTAAEHRLEPLLARLREIGDPTPIVAAELDTSNPLATIEDFRSRLNVLRLEMREHRADPVTAALLAKHHQAAVEDTVRLVDELELATQRNALAEGPFARLARVERSRVNALERWAAETGDPDLASSLIECTADLRRAVTLLTARLDERSVVVDAIDLEPLWDASLNGSDDEKRVAAISSALLQPWPADAGGVAIDEVSREVYDTAREMVVHALVGLELTQGSSEVGKSQAASR